METASLPRVTSLRKTPCESGYRPVIKLARYGEQTGQQETAVVKRTLWEARRSRLGVKALGSLAKPAAWARH